MRSDVNNKNDYVWHSFNVTRVLCCIRVLLLHIKCVNRYVMERFLDPKKNTMKYNRE